MSRGVDEYREEARRLVKELHDLADSLGSMPDGQLIADAAALIDTYQAGVTLVTPHPLTGAYLVERINPSERLPDNTETVLVWSDSEDNLPWLGWYDGTAWQYVDSTPIQNVTGWAYRPGGR